MHSITTIVNNKVKKRRRLIAHIFVSVNTIIYLDIYRLSRPLQSANLWKSACPIEIFHSLHNTAFCLSVTSWSSTINPTFIAVVLHGILTADVSICNHMPARWCRWGHGGFPRDHSKLASSQKPNPLIQTPNVAKIIALATLTIVQTSIVFTGASPCALDDFLSVDILCIFLAQRVAQTRAMVQATRYDARMRLFVV